MATLTTPWWLGQRPMHSSGGWPLPPVSSGARVKADRIGLTLDGQPYYANYCDAYTLPLRIERGDDVLPFLQDCAAKGFNGLSMFMEHWAWWFTADESKWNRAHSFVVGLPAVKQAVALAGEYGFHVELRCICDEGPEQFNHGYDWVVTRLSDTAAAVKDLPNLAFFVMMNEPPGNGGYDMLWRAVDELGWQHTRPGAFLLDSGDYDVMRSVEGYQPPHHSEGPFRYLDSVGDHMERKRPGQASEAGKYGHNIYDGWGPDQYNGGFPGAKCNVRQSEPDKWGSDADGSNNQDVQNAEDCAAGFALSAGGATFHSASGIMAEIPTEQVQIDAARVWVEATRFYPPDICHGEYGHMGLGNFPFKRSDPDAGGSTGEHYGRKASDGTWWTGVAETKEPYDAAKHLQPGWKLLAQAGSHGQRLHVGPA